MYLILITYNYVQRKFKILLQKLKFNNVNHNLRIRCKIITIKKYQINKINLKINNIHILFGEILKTQTKLLMLILNVFPNIMIISNVFKMRHFIQIILLLKEDTPQII